MGAVGMARNPKAAPRIAFVGTGAQGASLGADFALAGLDVTFIEQWPAHVEAIREKGITVNLPTRTINAKVPALHLCQVAEIREPFDLVFLVVKAYDALWSSHLIASVLAPDGLVVGLQNGMTHEAIASVVGRERTIGAVLELASNMFTPGVVNRQNDHDRSWFSLGALDAGTQPRVDEVARLLRVSGTVEVTNDIKSAKWMKLVVNAAELIPSSIVNLSLCDAARTPGVLEVMRQAGYEAMEAAIADGATITPIIGMQPVISNHPERYVDQILETVLEAFSAPDTLATSLQDWRKGRRSEVREINGRVVEILKSRGKPAPINERMVELALAIEKGALAPQLSNVSLLTSSAAPNG